MGRFSKTLIFGHSLSFCARSLPEIQPTTIPASLVVQIRGNLVFGLNCIMKLPATDQSVSLVIQSRARFPDDTFGIDEYSFRIGLTFTNPA